MSSAMRNGELRGELAAEAFRLMRDEPRVWIISNEILEEYNSGEQPIFLDVATFGYMLRRAERRLGRPRRLRAFREMVVAAKSVEGNKERITAVSNCLAQKMRIDGFPEDCGGIMLMDIHVVNGAYKDILGSLVDLLIKDPDAQREYFEALETGVASGRAAQSIERMTKGALSLAKGYCVAVAEGYVRSLSKRARTREHERAETQAEETDLELRETRAPLSRSERFFVEKIKEGLAFSGDSLGWQEEKFLARRVEDLRKGAELSSEQARKLQAKCVGALATAYARETAGRNKQVAVEWRDHNGNVYEYSERVISPIVQEWYLSVGRAQEKRVGSCLSLLFLALSGVVCLVAAILVILSTTIGM